MGAITSNLFYKTFENFNDLHIIAGSGLVGLLIYLQRGIHTHLFKTVCISGLTIACLSYSLLSKERVTVSAEKVVLITGCDSGLGFSFAQHLSDMGFTVLAACLSLKSDGAKELQSKYMNMFLLELDITDSKSIKKAVATVQNFLAINEPCELWAIVNNAGVMVFGEFEWLTERLIKSQIDVNIYGTMCFTNAFLPFLRKYSGRVITISSHCAKSTLPGLAVYGASKAALLSWCDGLRVEMGKYGVSVVSFIPGSFVQCSNLMAKQNENVLEMQSAMSEEQFFFYGNYFKRYNTYLSALSGTRKPIKIQDTILYEKFEQCLLEKHPAAVYVYESWKYKIFYLLFQITPYSFRDALVVYFMKTPSWEPKAKMSQISNVIT